MDYEEPEPSDSDEEESETEEDEEDTEMDLRVLRGRGFLSTNRNVVDSVAVMVSSHEAQGIVDNADDSTVEGVGEMKDNDVIKTSDDNGEENNKEELGEIDGLFCPICFDAWSSEGNHQVCCLPCGHIYGLACIKKWLRRRGSSKCPQCKKKCAIKDIRLLYASRIVTVDGGLQKKVQSLEAKCVSLEKKNTDLSKNEVQWKKREVELSKQVRYLKQRTLDLEVLLNDTERRTSASSVSDSGLDTTPKFHMQGCSNKFMMKKDFRVDGARLFDIDSSSQIFIIAGRLPGMGGMHVLTKMSLHNYEKEDIQLPGNTKAVKDLRVSPYAKLVLVASLGKKLSVLSTESNNTILNYDLPAAAWSCSWDICSSHYVYAGLQNGTMLQFDLRHTTRHVESMTGLSGNPVHTVQSLSPDSSPSSGVRSVLTASSLGLCQWNFGKSEERPFLVPGSEDYGVCISLAYCPTTNDIVSSYRPKIETSGVDVQITQPTLSTFTGTPSGQAVPGTHVYFKRMSYGYQTKDVRGGANVSNIGFPKSAILDRVCENPWFASADEVTCELMFQELPNLTKVGQLKPRKYPILDVKYSHVSNSGLLGCLSEGTLQLFTAKHL